MSLRSKVRAVIDLFNTRRVKNKPQFRVMSIEDTVNKIINERLSVSRYGDGELLMMANQMNESFQTYDKELAQRLKKVASCPIDKHIVCISDIFGDLEKYNDNARKWFDRFLARKKYLWYRYFSPDKEYGNAHISRPYMDLVDKSKSAGYFDLLKQIWHGRNVIIIEGEFSRLGVGNDLFDGTKSIKRILCPAINAYNAYNKIFEAANTIDKSDLILIALGATATALAYDLAERGYQAIDIGHVDIEYEWMKIGATQKVAVSSKYVNEASDGHCTDSSDDNKYLSEIIMKISSSQDLNS